MLISSEDYKKPKTASMATVYQGLLFQCFNNSHDINYNCSSIMVHFQLIVFALTSKMSAFFYATIIMSLSTQNEDEGNLIFRNQGNYTVICAYTYLISLINTCVRMFLSKSNTKILNFNSINELLI